MKVLIIEDDRDIVDVIKLAFDIRWPDAEIISTHLGERGVELVEEESPDVVILDVGLVDISGFDALKRIRAFSTVPVLILTVRAEESDIVRGLEWGADDYMVKPFRQLELLSRIRALVRRTSPLAAEAPLVCGDLRFDPATRLAHNGAEEVHLTRTEACVLGHLMANVGHVVTHAALAVAIWNEDYPDAASSLKVYVRRLREKLEANPSDPQLILTRPGVGYSLARP